MTTFQRNAIISGYINAHCLVCEHSFDTEDQVFLHIKSSDHVTKLLAHPHLDKFKNNAIRKVKAGYFCEYCNQLFATGAKVSLHAAEKLHISNKGKMLLKRSGSSITYDDVLLEDNAYHSIQEDECLICDTEFDDMKEHVMQRSHIVKLLQSQVEMGDTENCIYRKIDKNNIQCLTCNLKVPIDSQTVHFTCSAHKEKYTEGQNNKKKHEANLTTMVNTNPTKIEKIEISEEKKITVDNYNNVATITGAAKAIIKENQEVNKPKTVVNQPKDSDLVTYAKENQLIYDPKQHNTYCTICVSRFPSTLHGMKEHINGKAHINKNNRQKTLNVKVNVKQIKLTKTSMEQFIENVHTLPNKSNDYDIIINETICITQMSISTFCLTKIPRRYGKYTCEICNVELSEEDFEQHSYMKRHSNGVWRAPVITKPKLKNEFIREVRPDIFHCGYCNIPLRGWDSTEAHLKSAEHKTNAQTSHRRLQKHLHAIRTQTTANNTHAAIFEKSPFKFVRVLLKD